MVVPMIQAVYHSMSNFASKYDSNVNFIHFKEQSIVVILGSLLTKWMM